MEMDDPARKQFVQRMVEMTLAVNANNGGEEERGETAWEHRNKRDVGFDTIIMHDVRADEDTVDKIMKDHKSCVKIDDIWMTRPTKEEDAMKYETE